MRYTEQIKHSWGYNWGVAREVWAILTNSLHWWVVSLFFLLCVVPCFTASLAFNTFRYVNTPEPQFDFSVPQDIIYERAYTNYYYNIKSKPPPFLLLLNYYWVMGSNFRSSMFVLWMASTALLFVARLRELRTVRDREVAGGA